MIACESRQERPETECHREQKKQSSDLERGKLQQCRHLNWPEAICSGRVMMLVQMTFGWDAWIWWESRQDHCRRHRKDRFPRNPSKGKYSNYAS